MYYLEYSNIQHQALTQLRYQSIDNRLEDKPQVGTTIRQSFDICFKKLPEQGSGKTDKLLFPNRKIVSLCLDIHIESGPGLILIGRDNFLLEVSLFQS